MIKSLAAIVVLAAFIAVSIGGCNSFKESPKDKVATLKRKKEALKESSGYNECMRQVEEAERAESDCETDGISARGFADTAELRCISNDVDIDWTRAGKHHWCREKRGGVSRYSAEVYAFNECIEKSKNNVINEFDCAKLMWK